MRAHYALLVRQRQAWVDGAREKAALRAKAAEAEAAEAEAAEAEGAAREAEAFRRLDHTAQAIALRDSAWLDDRQRATAVEVRPNPIPNPIPNPVPNPIPNPIPSPIPNRNP